MLPLHDVWEYEWMFVARPVPSNSIIIIVVVVAWSTELQMARITHVALWPTADRPWSGRKPVGRVATCRVKIRLAGQKGRIMTA